MTLPQIRTWKPPWRDGLRTGGEGVIVFYPSLSNRLTRGVRLFVIAVVAIGWRVTNTMVLTTSCGFGFCGDNCTRESGADKDCSTTSEPLPVSGENPHESGESEEDDTGGDDDFTKRSHQA